jgi:hypothetical protein
MLTGVRGSRGQGLLARRLCLLSLPILDSRPGSPRAPLAVRGCSLAPIHDVASLYQRDCTISI